MEKSKATTSGEGHPPDIVEMSIGSYGRWHWWVVLWASGIKFSVMFHQISIVFHAPKVKFTCSNSTMDWDLVCDRFQYNNIAQMVAMSGILTGNFVFGILSDRFGRKYPFVGAVVLQLVSGCLAGYVPWFWLHLVLRYLCTTATGGTMITSFVLIMEVVGVKWRSTVGILYQLPFNVGQLLLPGFSYFLRDWRHMQFAITITSVVFLAYYWVLPESPRWLLVVGEVQKAIRVLERAAKHNRLPTEQIQANVTSYAAKLETKEKKGGNFLLLFKTRRMRVRSICIFYNWLVFGLCFFGLIQYVGELGRNVFITVAISGAAQIPGTIMAVFVIKWFGRKLTIILANLVGGISSIIIAIMIILPSDTAYWLKPMFGIIGIFGITIQFSTLYIYAGEIFPTIIRNVGCGISSVFARVGSLSAPFIAKASEDSTWLPPLVFGIAPIIGTLLCLVLPETLNCKLPDTIEEAENFGVKSKDKDAAK